MVWKIDKVFNFEYGHRVWVQKLNEEYCAKGDTSCACRHLHGHSAKVHIFVEASELNYQGMVVDFKMLGWLKDFIDRCVDHKFIIDINDPYYKNIINGELNLNAKTFTPSVNPGISLPLVEVIVPGTNHIAGYEIDTYTNQLTDIDKEYYESFFLINFIPTSENLSKWLFEVVESKMKLIDVTTSEVQWFETAKSRSTYTKSA